MAVDASGYKRRPADRPGPYSFARHTRVQPHPRRVVYLFIYLFVSVTVGHEQRQSLDRPVLRRSVRLPGQARRRAGRLGRRRDQGLAHVHETLRQAQRRTGAEQRTRVGQPLEVFPQRRPVRPTVQGLEE